MIEMRLHVEAAQHSVDAVRDIDRRAYLLAELPAFGAAAGGIVPAISALLANYTQPGEEGSVYGIDNSIVAGARAAAPLVGSIIAYWFDLRATFVATAVVFLLVALISFLRLPHDEAAPLPTLGD